MSLKTGIVEISSNTGYYFPITTRKGKEYSYARALFCWEPRKLENGKWSDEKPKIYLRFLNGHLGCLIINTFFQLKVSHLDTSVMWVPTEKQFAVMYQGSSMSNDMVVFDGKHAISEVFPLSMKPQKDRRLGAGVKPYLDQRVAEDPLEDESVRTSVPPEEHSELADRFKEPVGLWNQVVAKCLGIGQTV